MMLASTLPDYLLNPTIGGAAVIALLGYGVVFLGIIALMCVVMVMGKIFVSLENKKKAELAASVVPVEPVPEQPKPVAPGAAGELKLHDVEPKTAAMLMAIVANQMGKPLNELRFISIKEVKE